MAEYEQYLNDPNYTVEKDSSGNITRIYRKPKEYMAASYKDSDQPSGYRQSTGTYTEHEIKFSEGKPFVETYYNLYNSRETSSSRVTQPYAHEVISYDYGKQMATRNIYDVHAKGNSAEIRQTQTGQFNIESGAGYQQQILDIPSIGRTAEARREAEKVEQKPPQYYVEPTTKKVVSISSKSTMDDLSNMLKSGFVPREVPSYTAPLTSTERFEVTTTAKKIEELNKKLAEDFRQQALRETELELRAGGIKDIDIIKGGSEKFVNLVGALQKTEEGAKEMSNYGAIWLNPNIQAKSMFSVVTFEKIGEKVKEMTQPKKIRQPPEKMIENIEMLNVVGKFLQPVVKTSERFATPIIEISKPIISEGKTIGSQLLSVGWIESEKQQSKAQTEYLTNLYEKYSNQPGVKASLARGYAKAGTFAEKWVNIPLLEAEKGFRLEIKEHPVKVGLTFAAFAVLPGVLGGTRAGLTSLGVKIWKPLEWGFAIGLPALYATKKGIEYTAQPKGKKSEYLGRTVSGEVVPMFAGYSFGTWASKKAVGLWRTEGMEKVAIEDITTTKVLTGEETFPTGPQQKHYAEFMKGEYQLAKIEKFTGSRYEPGEWIKVNRFDYPMKKIAPELGVWHAAPESFKIITTTQVGTSELPGMYVSPSLSPHFLKVTNAGAYGYRPELFPSLTPEAIYVYPSGIKPLNMPEKMISGFLTGQAQKGIAYVPGVKSEIEALIPPETMLTRINLNKFFEWQGVRIPIGEYRPDVSVTPTFIKNIGSIISDSFSSLRSTISPTFFWLASYKPSKSTTKITSSIPKVSAMTYIPSTSSVTSSSFFSKSYITSISRMSSSISRTTSTVSKTSSIVSRPSSIISRMSSAISGGSSVVSKVSSTISGGSSIISKVSTPSYTTSYKVPPFRYIPPPPPFIPNLTLKGKQPKYKSLFKFKRPTRYQPSAFATHFKIKGKMPKYLSGLEIRPVLIGKHSKRRR